MFAIRKRRNFAIAILLGVSLLVSLSYFTFGRTKKSKHAVSSLPPAATANETPAGPASLDSDSDGLPDTVELSSYSDRENFRAWFRLIAEAQYYELNKDWNAEQRDCAGLVRFAWRETLRRHDRSWFQKMGPLYKTVASDIKRYHLDNNAIGEKLFRTQFGAYKEGDVDSGVFSEFADARTLKTFNAKFISRDRREARPGDLLFFYRPWVQKYPYHVMVYVGPSQIADDQTPDWVVYHTGASPVDEGTVKKVALSVLDHHPNRRWRPIESNSNFLGFYRLKILD